MGNKYDDISIGGKYGNWDVLSYSQKTTKRVVCKCSCGNIKEVDKYSIKRGDSQSCGCKRTPIKNITNKRFGRLLALEPHTKRNTSNKIMWVCLCDCGNTTIVTSNGLIMGTTKSCGCLKNETASKLGKSHSLPKGEASFNNLYKKYQEGAKKRKLRFSLSKNEFKKLTSKDCFYCGSKPTQKNHPRSFKGSYVYNGIDRLDNNIGYIYDNCVPCCGTCNKMKGSMELHEFIDKIDAIYNKVKGAAYGR